MTVLPSAPPLSPYGTLTGQLFLYGGGRAAFESPACCSDAAASSSPQQQLLAKNKCILIGGLSDGLLPVPYAEKLEAVCARTNDDNDNNGGGGDWSLVQPILSGSYLGFGHGSLGRDTSELNELLLYLVEHRHGDRFCLVGHSTGCQNTVHYLRHGHPDLVGRISAVVMQAPVSDREHAMLSGEDYDKYLAVAQQMRADGNKLEECMPRDAFWAPITASRYLDLHERGGADDLFSSDYSDAELTDRLRHVGSGGTGDGVGIGGRRQVLVAFSGSDEYVPESVDKRKLTDRLVGAMNADCISNSNSESMEQQAADEAPPVRALYLPTANHNLSNDASALDAFVDAVEELLVRSTGSNRTKSNAVRSPFQ